MVRSTMSLALVCLAAGLCGAFVGGAVGLLCISAPFPTFLRQPPVVDGPDWAQAAVNEAIPARSAEH